ncbi:HlyD family type I secretion periplasmic adaptor subunit [Pseudomonas sp. N040]|nr:HlyD family type I secretion periplasmic adaptor subunit [Pseudomonas sp. N040]
MLGAQLHGETRQVTRLGLWAIALGFGGFLLWATFAPLDEGVPTSGIVSVDTKRKTIQHLQGGLIREVLVREGQLVEPGQILIRLDDGIARANYESVRQHYLGLRAKESRLLAEQQGLDEIIFHPSLVEAAASDPLIRQHTFAQIQLLRSRRASLAANLKAIEESINGQESVVRSYRSAIDSRQSQIALLERELKGVRNLVKDGYAPLNHQMELERSVGEIAAASAELQADLAQAQGMILELRQREQGLRSDYSQDVDAQLTDVLLDVQAEAERFKAVSEELARTQIRTPVGGHVVGLSVQTVGGVVQAGERLMDVVPQDEALVLETRVPPNLIDRIHLGAPVDVRFSSFAHSPQLVVEGVVHSISADILTDPASNLSYYLARVTLSKSGMRKLGQRQLQPGMPVEVVIKTGERTLLTYLLHPLTKRLSASMTEE